MSATVGTVTVEVKPDAEAIAKAVREGVAGVLRAIADEIEAGSALDADGLPTAHGRYRDKDGDTWRLDAGGWYCTGPGGHVGIRDAHNYTPMTRTGEL